MRAGPKVIFQAAFFDGRWRGYADFLLRVEHSSKLGDFSYEVLDTKLARPFAVLRAPTCLLCGCTSRRAGRMPGTWCSKYG